jgi:ATP-dependent protease ClpP protease subunit
MAINDGRTNIIIQISSSGGSTSEGYALYYFLRSLPVSLTMHNIGSVESIANIVFLAGEMRRACKHSHFMFHNFTWTYGEKGTFTNEQMKEHALSLRTDESRFKSILQEHTSLTEDDFNTFNFFKEPYIVEAGLAKEKGIIHEIADAKVPCGFACWNVDY